MSKTESPADATTARLPRYDFRHKVAVVTGGSRGLGRAIVERLERDGASVWVLDVAPDTTAPRQLVADVTDPEALARCAETIRAQSGGIDILVHSAGMAGATAPLVESDPKTWRRVVDINLVGAFEVCRCFVPHLLGRPRAWLVNLASLAGKEGTPNASAYSAAKAGVVALTKSLAKEHATTGLRINALAPAAIDTELLGSGVLLFSPAATATPPVETNPLRNTLLGLIVGAALGAIAAPLLASKLIDAYGPSAMFVMTV